MSSVRGRLKGGRTTARRNSALRNKGERTEFVAIARTIMEEGRAKFATEMAGDDKFLHDFAEVLKKGARAFDPDSMKIVARMLSWMQEERRLVVEFVRSLGASSEDELKEMVEAYRSAGDGDTLTAIERLTTGLEALLPLHEGHRPMVVKRLGGVIAIPEAERV